MRGADITQAELFSYWTLEERIPQDQPLRKLRGVVDVLLKSMDDDFAGLYARTGRESIPLERLLRASLLQVLFSIRSERQLVQHLDFNLLYRWFVGLTQDDPGVGPLQLQRQSRAPVERAHHPTVLRAGRGLRGMAAVAVRRAFLGGRNADRSLGLDEELRPQGRLVSVARGGWPQPRSGLQGRNAGNDTHASTTIRRPGFTERAMAINPSSASWAMR